MDVVRKLRAAQGFSKSRSPRPVPIVQGLDTSTDSQYTVDLFIFIEEHAKNTQIFDMLDIILNGHSQGTPIVSLVRNCSSLSESEPSLIMLTVEIKIGSILLVATRVQHGDHTVPSSLPVRTF